MICKWCNTDKEKGDFYLHPMMASGHLGKCKECCKAAAKRNYRDKREQKLQYEKKRNKTKWRKECALRYQRRRRKRYPEKDRARRMVAYYVRSGKLLKRPCAICRDKKVEAHHADYSRPLEVEWLCHFHHRQREGRLVQ